MGVLSNELSQERDLLTADGLPAIAPGFRFRHNRSMPEMKSERKPFVVTLVGVRQLTGRHTGAASVSGLPAASSNCA
jgi:hypothetical protein